MGQLLNGSCWEELAVLVIMCGCGFFFHWCLESLWKIHQTDIDEKLTCIIEMLEELAVELNPQPIQVATLQKPKKKNLAPLAKKMYLQLEHVLGLSAAKLAIDGYSTEDVVEVACTNPAFYFDENLQAVSLIPRKRTNGG